MSDCHQLLTDPEVSRLIGHKARTLIKQAGFASNDHHDLVQELRLRILQRWQYFDPTRGEPRAFLFAVLQNAARMLRRERQAQKHGVGRVQSLNALPKPTDPDQPRSDRLDRTIRSFEEVSDLVADLTVVLAKLPAHHRDLCERLMLRTPSEVARDLKIPASTLRRRCEPIRRMLEQHNFGKTS